MKGGRVVEQKGLGWMVGMLQLEDELGVSWDKISCTSGVAISSGARLVVGWRCVATSKALTRSCRFMIIIWSDFTSIFFTWSSAAVSGGCWLSLLPSPEGNR